MPYNDRLFTLLDGLGDTEIEALWTGPLKQTPTDNDFKASPRARRIELISRVWRAAHGHSVANLRRADHDLPWKRILVDVADKMTPGWKWTKFSVADQHTESDIEQAILGMYDARLQQQWANMSPKQQEAMASSLDEAIAHADEALSQQAGRAAYKGVAVGGLSAGIASGLIAGGGLLTIAQGSASYALAGALGGVLNQLGIWMAIQMFGSFAGTRLALGGSASLLGGAAITVPVGAALLAHAAMSTSYRKSLPATVMLLSWTEMHRQLNQTKE